MKKVAVALLFGVLGLFVCVKQYEQTQDYSCRSAEIVVETTVWHAVETNCTGNIGNAVYEILRINGITDPTAVQYGQVLRTE